MHDFLVMLTDFDLAAVNGVQNDGHTPMFASRNLFAKQSRCPMSDLESLVYSISYLAGVPLSLDMNDEILPEGYVLFQNLKKGRKFARSHIMVCIHLKLL